MLRVTIHEHLEQIKENQAKLADEGLDSAQCHVPNIKEMAKAVGTTPTNYYKWAGNRTANISRSITYGSIIYLQSLGFDTKLTDILRCDDEEV